MKLPYLLLPRTVYEDQQADRQRLEARVKELTDLLLDLKLDGAQIVRHNPEIVRRQAEKTAAEDLIDAAIDADPRSKNPMFRRGWRNWADRQLRDKRMSPDEIVQRIKNWDKLPRISEIVDAQDDEDRAMGLIP